ncbi:hypothetical protein FGG08_000712 [Glutinoglossum americanum]|uniref:Beta-Ala-His dipeptidase n=1 Tax=Glutinoglossum americanum TaxID=1670608 RepID=A0A9P8IHW0_9PEZI|nr:hypothetical protein FGG08_000712 [Glutinoglossum americanum]
MSAGFRGFLLSQTIEPERERTATPAPRSSASSGSSDDGRDQSYGPASGGQRGGEHGVVPTLFHRVKHNNSILALVVSQQHIYAGTQAGEILVWSLKTYEVVATIYGHRSSVLCLCLSEDQKLLFSSAGDAIINWYDLKEKDTRPPPRPILHPSCRNHRFFDSKGPGGVQTPPRPISSGEANARAQGGQTLEIDSEHIIQYAHYGYVYCMLLARGLGRDEPDEEVLISGGGDGTVKLWGLDNKAGGGISEITELENGDSSVLTLALDGTLLYAGTSEGDVNVWDLDTRQMIRSVKAHADDVLTLSIGGGLIFSAGGSGYAKKFNQKYECIGQWEAHSGLILASAVSSYNDRRIYVTGGNDDCVAIWDVSDCLPEPIGGSKSSNEQLLGALARLISFKTVSSNPQFAEECRRGATYLRTLFKRFGAITEMFNTDNNLNPVVFAKFKGNPMESKKRKKILFYGHYDVIAAEDDQGKWISDPFTLEGVSGYLYGRGVSDNKGPILAALFAVADLVSEQTLDSDIIFLIEGEEESGSRGFEKAIRQNREIIGDIDWILVANSYWLDDEVPCLTYGLRGVIHATVQVESDHPDLHSGVDGSELMDESLKDLVMLLAKLTGPHGRVEIPGFYAPILPVTDAEKERYAEIANTLIHRNPALSDSETLIASLMHRWRDASLTIHRFKVSGPENSTVIPRMASAALSLRLVPNQEVSVIKKLLIDFLEDSFKKLESKNHLTIAIEHEAEPWLGDPENELFRTLEEAIMDVWGPIGEGKRTSISSGAAANGVSKPKASPMTSSTLTSGSGHTPIASPTNTAFLTDATPPPHPHNQKPRRPLYIREGGSIPSIRFLEKQFSAPAAHLPCGQASDSAHLDNERFRLANLYNSREIFKRVFRELPKK